MSEGVSRGAPSPPQVSTYHTGLSAFWTSETQPAKHVVAIPFSPSANSAKCIITSLPSLQKQPKAAPTLFQRGVEHGRYPRSQTLTVSRERGWEPTPRVATLAILLARKAVALPGEKRRHRGGKKCRADPERTRTSFRWLRSVHEQRIQISEGAARADS